MASESPSPDQIQYGRDGWPRCPSCAADELLNGSARPEDPLECQSCGWRGKVPLATWLERARRGIRGYD